MTRRTTCPVCGSPMGEYERETRPVCPNPATGHVYDEPNGFAAAVCTNPDCEHYERVDEEEEAAMKYAAD